MTTEALTLQDIADTLTAAAPTKRLQRITHKGTLITGIHPTPYGLANHIEEAHGEIFLAPSTTWTVDEVRAEFAERGIRA